MQKEFEIAVIDDDESFRMALVDSLSSLGYRADGYPSAEECIDAVADRVFDCIITDIHMQGMSGLELMQWLIAHETQIPVILITAHTDLNLRTKAVAAGAVCLLRKPFEINDLITCIEGAVPN